jgi:hypothetical protein
MLAGTRALAAKKRIATRACGRFGGAIRDATQ